MPSWRGWPGERTSRRKWLDDLYWGNSSAKPGEGWYFLPVVHSDIAIAPLATWRDAHVDANDTDTRRVLQFTAAWGHWRAAMDGHDLDTRLKYNAVRFDHRPLRVPPTIAMLLYGKHR